MPNGKLVVLMGSKRDYPFASRISKFLEDERFNVKCDFAVASAHKTPKKLLKTIERYNKEGEHVVFVTVAGLSDALSGVVAGSTKYPVIACPPDSEKFGWAKFFSSAVTPRGVAVAYVVTPENAALSAVKILGLHNERLQKKVDYYMRRLKHSVHESPPDDKAKR